MVAAGQRISSKDGIAEQTATVKCTQFSYQTMTDDEMAASVQTGLSGLVCCPLCGATMTATVLHHNMTGLPVASWECVSCDIYQFEAAEGWVRLSPTPGGRSYSADREYKWNGTQWVRWGVTP